LRIPACYLLLVAVLGILEARCGAIRDWTIAQIPWGAAGFDPLLCDGKTLGGSIKSTGGADFLLTVKPNQRSLHR
jgi:hypothetical protein